MQQIILVPITTAFETQILQYKAEFIQHGDVLAGTANLAKAESFATWLQAVHDNACEETVHVGLVPATTLLAVRQSDSRLVGMIDIRHRLNEFLLQFGGNIGYSVRRSERCKGYATQMLALALTHCKGLGMEKVLVTCNKENIASAKTIQKCGGVLENEVPEGDAIAQRYWLACE